jgi:hypothetical protein
MEYIRENIKGVSPPSQHAFSLPTAARRFSVSWKIVSEVWSKAQVSSSELLVLLTIAEHCHPCYHGWISYGRLAKRTRLDERTVKRLVARLTDSHLHISPFKAPNGANVYTLLCPWQKTTAHLGRCGNCNNKGVVVCHRDPKEDPISKKEAETIALRFLSPDSALFKDVFGRNGH